MTRRFAHSAQQRLYDAMLIHGSADRVTPGGGTSPPRGAAEWLI